MVAGGATLLAGVGLSKLAAAEDVEMQPLSAITRVVPPSPMPDVALTRLDGSACHLSDFFAKGLVLNFWATWCVPCVAELPELDRLAGSHPGFAVVAVSADHGGAAVVAPFLKNHEIAQLTVLLDPGLAAVHAAGVFGFPSTLVIDRHGAVRGRLDGPAAWSGAASMVAGLLA